MNEDYVSYEQAKTLKELGFNWACIGFYNHYKIPCIEHNICYEGKIIKENYNDDFIANTYNVLCSAPTLAQAQKWLREVKQIEVNSTYDLICGEGWFFYHNDLEHVSFSGIDKMGDTLYASYEQALSAGIDKALELLKEKK